MQHQLSEEKRRFIDGVLHGVHGAKIRRLLAPVVQVKRACIRRRLLTRSRAAAVRAMRSSTDAALACALRDAAPQLFAQLPAAAVAELLQLLRARPVAFHPGEMLAYRDEPAAACGVFVCVHGALRVERELDSAAHHAAHAAAAASDNTPLESSQRAGAAHLLSSSVTSRPTSAAVSSCFVAELVAPCVLGIDNVLGDRPHEHFVSAALVDPARPFIDGFRLLADEFLDVVARHARSHRPLRQLRRHAREATLQSVFPQTDVLMRGSWMCAALTPAALRLVVHALHPRTYLPGEALAKRGERTTHWTFIRRGVASVRLPSSATSHDLAVLQGHRRRRRHHQQRLPHTPSPPSPSLPSLLLPGSSFGEMSLLFNERRAATVIAESPVDTWQLHAADLSALMKGDEDLRIALQSRASVIRTQWLRHQQDPTAPRSRLHEILAAIPLFAACPAAVIDVLAAAATPRVLPQRGLIASASAACDCLYVVVRGRATSLRPDIPASFGAGSVIGEGCLVPGHRWPFAIAAKTMVDSWILAANDIRRILRAPPIGDDVPGPTTTTTTGGGSGNGSGGVDLLQAAIAASRAHLIDLRVEFRCDTSGLKARAATTARLTVALARCVAAAPAVPLKSPRRAASAPRQRHSGCSSSNNNGGISSSSGGSSALRVPHTVGRLELIDFSGESAGTGEDTTAAARRASDHLGESCAAASCARDALVGTTLPELPTLAHFRPAVAAAVKARLQGAAVAAAAGAASHLPPEHTDVLGSVAPFDPDIAIGQPHERHARAALAETPTHRHRSTAHKAPPLANAEGHTIAASRAAARVLLLEAVMARPPPTSCIPSCANRGIDASGPTSSPPSSSSSSSSSLHLSPSDQPDVAQDALRPPSITSTVAVAPRACAGAPSGTRVDALEEGEEVEEQGVTTAASIGGRAETAEEAAVANDAACDEATQEASYRSSSPLTAHAFAAPGATCDSPTGSTAAAVDDGGNGDAAGATGAVARSSRPSSAGSGRGSEAPGQGWWGGSQQSSVAACSWRDASTPSTDRSPALSRSASPHGSSHTSLTSPRHGDDDTEREDSKSCYVEQTEGIALRQPPSNGEAMDLVLALERETRTRRTHRAPALLCLLHDDPGESADENARRGRGDGGRNGGWPLHGLELLSHCFGARSSAWARAFPALRRVLCVAVPWAVPLVISTRGLPPGALPLRLPSSLPHAASTASSVRRHMRVQTIFVPHFGEVVIGASDLSALVAASADPFAALGGHAAAGAMDDTKRGDSEAEERASDTLRWWRGRKREQATTTTTTTTTAAAAAFHFPSREETDKILHTLEELVDVSKIAEEEALRALRRQRRSAEEGALSPSSSSASSNGDGDSGADAFAKDWGDMTAARREWCELVDDAGPAATPHVPVVIGSRSLGGRWRPLVHPRVVDAGAGVAAAGSDGGSGGGGASMTHLFHKQRRGHRAAPPPREAAPPSTRVASGSRAGARAPVHEGGSGAAAAAAAAVPHERGQSAAHSRTRPSPRPPRGAPKPLQRVQPASTAPHGTQSSLVVGAAHHHAGEAANASGGVFLRWRGVRIACPSGAATATAGELT